MTLRLVLPLFAAGAAMAPALAVAKTHTVDVNGDGRADLVISAPTLHQLLVFFGRAGGLPDTPDQTLDVTSFELIGLGDINGDGFGDVLADGELHLGSKTGLVAAAAIKLTTPDHEESGVHWSALGDINGDGFADLGASVDCLTMQVERTDPGPEIIECNTDKEHFYVWLGGKTGVSATPNLAADLPKDCADDAFLTGAGDLDADGKADVLRRNLDKVDVFLGTATGMASAPSMTISIEGIYIRRVASAGDLDGDGHDDVVMIGQRGNAHRAMAYVFLGTPAGLAATPAMKFRVPDDYWGMFGRAGDLDADGRDDLVLGELGRPFIRRGAPGGVSSRSIAIKQPHHHGPSFGFPAGSPGDLDGDGKADLVFGIGHVFVYRGGALDRPFAEVNRHGSRHDDDFGDTIATAPP